MGQMTQPTVSEHWGK